MGKPLLVAVSLAYAAVAISYWRNGRHGLALAFVGYVLANIGLILDYDK
jgi:hypothetical protein